MLFPSRPRASAALALAAFFAFLAAGCGRPSAPPAPVPPKSMADYFPIAVGGVPLRMQVAVAPGEQERGLMERTGLAPDEAMIFVSAAPQRLTFWMHDTPTPLDVGYFAADGELAEVYPLLPFDERPVASRRSDLQFALETNQGWYAAHGLRAGARIDFRALAAALKARGYDPAKFGIR